MGTVRGSAVVATAAHKQHNHCGASTDAEELEAEVFSVVMAQRCSQLFGCSSPARLDCFVSRRSKIRGTLSLHGGPKLQIDST